MIQDEWIEPDAHTDAISKAQEQYLNDEIDEQKLEGYLEFIYEHGEHPEEISALDLVRSHLSKHDNPEKVLVSNGTFRDIVGSTKVHDERPYGGTGYMVFGVTVEIDDSIEDDVKVITD